LVQDNVTARASASGSRVVYAGGGVLWRPGSDENRPEIALIHRARYDDWSLPKGKVDPGEVEPVTAVREIDEETGVRAVLGRRLVQVSYPVDNATKKVRYWAARAVADPTPELFTPNDEVDDLQWLSVTEAMTALSYHHDRKVLRRFTKHPADTSTLLIVRHGTAGRKSRYTGDDRKRPLDKYGRAQAEALVPLLLAFGATDVHAADRVRCQQTVEPLAEELSVGIRDEPLLTEEQYPDNRKKARQRVLDIAAKPGIRVICSQGKVIPDLVSWWCEHDGVRPDKSRNRKGSVWVMSLAGGKLIAADHIDSPIAGTD